MSKQRLYLNSAQNDREEHSFGHAINEAMPAQRTRQTCTACTRRKVKCSKTVPCTNCIRRGEIDLCAVGAIPGHVAEAREGSSVSPRQRHHQIQRHSNGHQDEVQMLWRRVAELEALLVSKSGTHASVETQPRPLASPESTNTTTTTDRCVDEDSQDTVIEDAASILEFLAWGRHKGAAAGSFSSNGADTISGAFVPDSLGDTSQLAVLQMLLPDERTIWRLVDYHVDSLLWFHTSFHAPAFYRQLERFFGQHGGRVEAPGVDLLWVALLFAVLTGSITCAPDGIVRETWAIGDEERAVLSRRWFRAVVACLNQAEYTANLSIVSVQAICTLTMSAHLLGFSNTQSIHLAAAVRIAQSLGLHRIGGSGRADGIASYADRRGRAKETGTTVEIETGRRLWLQLCCQDWFGIPFSESCLIHPLHSQSQPPINCHDEADTLQPLTEDVPTVTSYGRFLTAIASIMPQLQDGLLSRSTPFTRYEQVLASDRRMRTLATAGRPAFLASSTPLDPAWPAWVPWARHSLAISSAHKIIMIHRAFLSESLTNPAYGFTRRTCLAAAKTIIKEYRDVVAADRDGSSAGSGGPVLWVHQAFAVAAGIILILDVLHRQPAEPEYGPHLQLAEEVVAILHRFPTSLIAVRGVKLLSALLLEAGKYDHATKRSRGLNVPSFVRSFCGNLARNRQPESDVYTTGATRQEHEPLRASWTSSQGSSPSKGMQEKGTTGRSTETPFTNANGLGTGSENRPTTDQDELLFLPPSIVSSSTFGNLLYLANYDFPET
ncbi:c6 zinc finger domain containing protein [Grosmannia clavigera kw1407]|uniref:C6 zinc finger domain containing protein n=1 Tax=Grosmannia clavigera (strain kw1407 / UAMH 11150) TaxID=655863 RepID=F0XDS5_GROCL|nr:c6 zinc finger domain containing protein [Grosmannia clavigera kw1407]EFX04326.1 c6 zinc finger domain containing protein [Grosmannia clavigera kw1407]